MRKAYMFTAYPQATLRKITLNLLINSTCAPVTIVTILPLFVFLEPVIGMFKKYPFVFSVHVEFFSLLLQQCLYFLHELVSFFIGSLWAVWIMHSKHCIQACSADNPYSYKWSLCCRSRTKFNLFMNLRVAPRIPQASGFATALNTFLYYHCQMELMFYLQTIQCCWQHLCKLNLNIFNIYPN